MLLYNGIEDTTQEGKTVTVRLEKQNVDGDTGDVSWEQVGDDRVITLGKATAADETQTDVDNKATGSLTFDGLVSGTYRVYEVDSAGQAVEGTTATFTNLSTDGVYNVVGSGQTRELSHGAQEASVKLTNSLLEKGSIKVTKNVLNSKG